MGTDSKEDVLASCLSARAIASLTWSLSRIKKFDTWTGQDGTGHVEVTEPKLRLPDDWCNIKVVLVVISLNETRWNIFLFEYLVLYTYFSLLLARFSSFSSFFWTSIITFLNTFIVSSRSLFDGSEDDDEDAMVESEVSKVKYVYIHIQWFLLCWLKSKKKIKNVEYYERIAK